MTHPMLDVRGWQDANPDSSLVIADGAAVTVNLYDGMLVIKDGPRNNERTRRFAKVPRVMRHLAILSPHGYVSLDAQRWLADCDVTWAIIDRSGKQPRTLGISGAVPNVKLMRAQALTGDGGPLAHVGVEIVRGFTRAKLTGQAANCELIGNILAAKEIGKCLDAVEITATVEQMGGWEGKAAVEYWGAWKGLPVAWEYPKPMKSHWRAYPGRPTLRRSYADNRGATDPVNACLNFGYHVAETECILALSAAGLSPDMGIAHSDKQGRASFALDLLEVMRPEVDRLVLGLLSEPLVKAWFPEDTQGMVRVSSPLTHKIASDVRTAAGCLAASVSATVAMLNKILRMILTLSIQGHRFSFQPVRW